MGMRKRIRGGNDEADVDVTPLLDIVFIMLIFFIVTAVFISEDGIIPNLPEPPQDEVVNPATPMLLTVRADGFVQVDGGNLIDPMSTKNVAGEFFASNPKGVVIISAIADSKSGVAVTVLDQAELARRGAGGTGSVTITKAADE